MQMDDEVPEGPGADSTQGSRGFRRRWLMRFWRAGAQIANKVLEGSGTEVPKG